MNKRCGFGIAALLLGSSLLHGQVVRTFVSTTGSDINPCTKSAPCRNFAAAIAAVDSGGEVVAVDSGGFGAVTIFKTVTMLAPSGVHAAIAPTTGTAITIHAFGVTIRHLFLNSQGATTGIDVAAGGINPLSIQHCVIVGFPIAGINLSGPHTLHVTDTLIRSVIGGVGFGINVNGLTTGTPARAVIEKSEFIGMDHGVLVTGNSRVAVNHSSATFNNAGFGARNGLDPDVNRAELSVDSSAASGNNDGFYVSGDNAVMRVSNSASTGNQTRGFARFGTSTFETMENNAVHGNGDDTFGTMTPFPPN